MSVEILDVLRGNRHLQRLSADDLDALAAAFTSERLPAGHVIFSAGDRANAVHLILEGEVVATRTDRGHESVVQRAHPGDLFGLLGVLRHKPRSATCTTATPSEIASLQQQAVLLLFNHSAPIAYAFQKVLATQLARDLRASDQRFRDLLSTQPE